MIASLAGEILLVIAENKENTVSKSWETKGAIVVSLSFEVIHFSGDVSKKPGVSATILVC